MMGLIDGRFYMTQMMLILAAALLASVYSFQGNFNYSQIHPENKAGLILILLGVYTLTEINKTQHLKFLEKGFYNLLKFCTQHFFLNQKKIASIYNAVIRYLK